MRNSIFFLLDMQEALSRMIEVTKGITIIDFSQNWVLISAVRDQIMILGEAAKQVPPDICELYPDIPWSQLARTRDRLIHGYFKVDPNLLFMMATVRANILLPKITNIIIEMQKIIPDTNDD
jgi:uncharacterized protein with HEPN domain